MRITKEQVTFPVVAVTLMVVLFHNDIRNQFNAKINGNSCRNAQDSQVTNVALNQKGHGPMGHTRNDSIVERRKDFLLPSQENKNTQSKDPKLPNEKSLFPYIPEGLTNCDSLFKDRKPAALQFPELYSKSFDELDKILKPFEGTIEGSSANMVEQTQTYQTLAQIKAIKNVCETGFNVGHSALVFLSARSDIHMYSFDLGFHGYSKPGAKVLQKAFPGRLNVTWGDSQKTLTSFAKVNPDIKCDLLIVDGGHSYNVTKADLMNFRLMARKEFNLLIMDDYPCVAEWCQSPTKVWEEQLSNKKLAEHFKCTSFSSRKTRGFTVGKYLDL